MGVGRCRGVSASRYWDVVPRVKTLTAQSTSGSHVRLCMGDQYPKGAEEVVEEDEELDGEVVGVEPLQEYHGVPEERV